MYSIRKKILDFKNKRRKFSLTVTSITVFIMTIGFSAIITVVFVILALGWNLLQYLQEVIS